MITLDDMSSVWLTKELEKAIATAEERLREQTGEVPTPDEILDEPECVRLLAQVRALSQFIYDDWRLERVQRFLGPSLINWAEVMRRPQ